ncbi:hypothetical protein M8J77_008343 [Diaphorina citri]|nr:hypothetical protein M8J77_008343 [Diaphorina citri]
MMSYLLFSIVLLSSQHTLSSTAMAYTFNKIHSVCRKPVPYPKTENVFRFQIPDHKVSWTVDHPEYKPVEYTNPGIQGQVWADHEITPENRPEFKWNSLDGHVNRKSHNGVYSIDPHTGRPKNPFGRTGLTGRGTLGRWGPNHAADPIVTRWMRNGSVVMLHPVSSKYRLEFLAIQRREGKAWALPGGMVDKGEQALDAAQREFCEETLNSKSWKSAAQSQQKHIVSQLFAWSQPVYHGYIDDARNTDNAWMETVAFHVHDPSGSLTDKLDLNAGDDAVDVKWTPIEKNSTLDISHNDLIHKVAQYMNAHWSSDPR